ncbi:MAG: hypothetical protein M1834_007700 [Cirrosporium novae-zelandiae]|nr:MAG: hypothetical protein M1834_007700 [Cirrosporium novae-zelandiae]
MAQGAIKRSKASSTGHKHHASNNKTKPGTRVVAPKKATLIRQKKITKKFSAARTAQTEKSLANKVGHLELLAGGKKSKKESKDKK